MTLRPYQNAAVDAVLGAFSRGVQRSLYALPTGTGKTQVFVELARRWPKPGPVLVLAHREELLDQAAARFRQLHPGAWVSIEKGTQKADPFADVVVGSVQTLGRPKCTRLAGLSPSLVICDECFPAGTPVDGRPIEQIRVGDLVQCFNHETGVIEQRPVRRTFKSWVSTFVRVSLANGRQIECTPMHPIFARDSRTGFSAYVEACRLSGFHQVHCIGEGHENSCHELRGVREAGGVPGQDRTASASGPARREYLLLRGVQTGIRQPEKFCGDGRDKSRSRIGPDEAPQPDERSGRESQDERDPAGHRVETAGARGEWSPHGSSIGSRLGAGVGDGDFGADESETRNRDANLLQARCRKPGAKARDRGGRGFPSEPGQTGAGPAEGSLLALVRVDCVEVSEPAGEDRFGELCPSGFVYNLEVEGHHNYFAHGTLVHNCHHAPASSYKRTFERFGAFAPGGPALVGCTATPKRLDRIALANVFQESVFTYGIREAIEDGYLCDIRGFRVVSTVDLSKVKTTAGDFNRHELAVAVNDAARTADTIRHWKEIAADRPTIAFCADVAHAKAVAEAWREAGVVSEHIDGTMDTETRRGVLERFRSGETRVLTNVEVLTEGFDHPPISCVVMLRPTQSWGLYVQCVGRGTRIADGKADVIVLDVVDNCTRHSLASVPAILDLPPGMDLEGQTLTKAARKIQELDEAGTVLAALAKYKPASLSALETALKDVDLLAAAQSPPVVVAHSRLTWLQRVDGTFALSLPGNRLAVLAETGRWSLGLYQSARLVSTTPSIAPTAEEALARADEIVLRTWPESSIIASRTAGWRGHSPSDGQVNMLRRLGYTGDYAAQLTKGQASDLITASLEQKKAKAGR